MNRASAVPASRAAQLLISGKHVCNCDDSRALQKQLEQSPIRRLQQWADGDRDRHFEVRYIAEAASPWAVELSNDSVSWSVTEDCHDSLERAVDFALREAAKEER